MLQDPIDQVIDSRVEQMVPDAQLRAQFDLDGEEHPLDLSQRALRLAQFASVIGADNGQRVEVLCADEPDVGLDITGRSALHAGFASHLQRGGGIVLACMMKTLLKSYASTPRWSYRKLHHGLLTQAGRLNLVSECRGCRGFKFYLPSVTATPT